MPFPAHKQPSARARSRNSPEPAQADALGSMLVSIAESAAALGDNRLPNAVDKSCHDKGNFGNATGEVDEQADCCGDSSGHLIADLSAVDLALDSHGHHAKHSRQSSHSAAPLTAADFSFDSQAGQPMRSHSPTDNSSSWALGSDVEAPQDAALQQSGPTSLVNAGRGHSAALQMPQPTSSIRHTRPQSAAVQMSAAAALSRPASAQPLAKSPGTFLRHARPQSAAATNVAAHGGLKALWREGQRRYGNRPISASQAGQSQNHVSLQLCLSDATWM